MTFMEDTGYRAGASKSTALRAGRRTSARAVLAALAILAAAASARPALGENLDSKLPVVRRIEILGNRSFDDGELKKRMRTREARFYHVFRAPRYRPDMLRRDVASIQSFYRSNGFFSASVSIDTVAATGRSGSVRIRLLVNEGPQTLVASLGFAGQDVVPEPELRTGLKLVEGRGYNPNLLEVDRYTLFSKFFERGYLGSRIAYDARVDSLAARIAWEISPGVPMYVRGIAVEGTKGVREGLVRRELTFSPGELFQPKRVLDSKQNLYDTGYFNSVEIEPDSIDLQNRRVDLAVRVRERKTGYVEAGFGVGNVLGSRVFGEWGQRNILGRGWSFSLKTQHSFQLFPDGDYSLSNMDFRSKYMRNEGEVRYPHILRTRNVLAVGAYYERDASVEPIVVTDRGWTTRLSRRFTRKTSASLGYSLDRVTREGADVTDTRSRQRTLDANFSRDTRDFYFNPRTGSYLSAEAGMTGGFLGGDDHFYTLAGAVQRYHAVGGGTVLAWRIRGGHADVFGDSRGGELPVESRFYAGGGNSVRGFRENSIGPANERGDPLGGRVQLIANAEARFGLPLVGRFGFGGAVFLDGGNVWNSWKEITAGDFAIGERDAERGAFLYGAGFGVRYHTPVGPIRLDIGFPLKRTSDMEDDYRFHISLGQIF